MENKSERYSRRKAIACGCDHISEQTACQPFTLLVFTFYFSVVSLNILLISVFPQRNQVL